MSYKIIIDSCGEFLDEWKDDERFESVPLTLNVGGETVIDDDTFDQAEFLKKVAACPECPKSACPSPERYMKAYECEADHIYAVTLSSELSGSYNSAVLGKDLFLEENPGRNVYVFNSRSASVGETLIGIKIQECEEAGCSFRETVERVEKYIAEQNTFFVLDDLETLRKNGRLSRVKSLVASALKIKPVMGSILDWIRQYSKDETETYLRGFLGRMLFSGDDIFKSVDVLSGGEKVRCMFSRMMLFQSNVLILDRPTNHLDLESITAVNNGLSDFKGNVLFASHDYEIVQTVANRIIEIADKGCYDRQGTYEEYVDWRKANHGGSFTL